MLRNSCTKYPFYFLTFAIFLLTQFASGDDDDFRWQDASAEVDLLPFKQTFIDSLKNAYDIKPQAALRNLGKSPICKNETLVYQVSWGPFNAGNVILTTTYDSVNNIIELGGKALSNNFVGAFYKMRDYVISRVDASGLYPLFFEQHLREGKKFKRDSWILYDLINNQMHVREKKYMLYEAPQFTHDYLSILYYIRNMKPVSGDTFTVNLYINSKIHPMFFKCKEEVKLQTDNGPINCFRIEPRLAGEGANFNKRDKLEVWLSNDSVPTPIVIKSKIKVGSLNAKLIWHNQKDKIIPLNPKL